MNTNPSNNNSSGFLFKWQSGFLSQFISTIYIALISFLLSVVLARKLGVVGFGDYSYLLGLAGIFMIFQNGGYKVLIFREGVNSNVKNLLSNAIGHLLFITFVGLTFVFLFKPNNWTILIISITCMGLIVLSEFVSSLFRSEGRYHLDSIWRILLRTFSALLILYVVFFIEVYTLGLIFLAWATALLIGLVWPISKGWLSKPTLNIHNEFFRANMAFLTIEMATILYFRSDIVLLEYLGNNLEDVGQYAAAYRVLEGIILLATPIAVIVFRELRLRVSDSRSMFRLLFRLLPLMLFFAILIVSLSALWGSKFIVLFFGSNYQLAGELLFWLMLALVFILPNYILTQGLIVLNKEVGYAKIAIIVALLNIALNIWLIPIFGAYGALWATIFSEGVLFLGLIWIVFNEWKRRNHENWS
jgi:O-antigen/teichoic acid export membrane protein